MKHVHGLLILGLSVFAACDPPASPPTPGATALPTRGAALMAAVDDGSMQAHDLGTTTTTIEFNGQQVCRMSAARRLEVHNMDSAVARQISFAGVTAPFVLTRIEDSTQQELTPPFSLAAGQSVYFFVAFRPGELGSFPGNLTLVTDDPVQGLFTIELSGEGIGPRLELSSSQLILVPGASAMVTLENTGTQEISSLAATVRSPFSAPLGVNSLAPGDTAPLSVTFPASAAGTFFSDNLTISSNDPCRPSQKIKVVGALTSTPQLVLSHPPLSFSAVEGNVSAPIPVKVKNHGGARLQVSAPTLEGISTPGAGTQFAVTPAFSFRLEPGEEHTLNVKFAPTAPGTHTAQLHLASNSEGSPHSADLSGDATAASRALESTPPRVTFPTQGADEPGEVTYPVEIVNTGNVPLNLSASTSADGASNPFRVAPASFALSPQEHKLLTVKFNSTNLAVGTFRGQLTLRDGAFSLEIPLQSKLVSTLFAITPSTADFESLELDVTATRTRVVSLTNWSDNPVTVIGATRPGSPFSVDLPASGRLIPAHGTESIPLQITFTPSAPGTFTETLRLLNTPKATAPELSLTGTAFAPSLSLSEPQVTFPRQLPYGVSGSVSVTLTNVGNMNVSLEQVSLGGDFTLKTSMPRALLANQPITLDFAFTPQSAGYKEVRPEFRLKPGEGREIRSSPNFWLRGTASGPVAVFSPDQLTFGSQQVTRSKELQIQLRNHSDSPENLKLTRVEIVGDPPTANAFVIAAIGSGEPPIAPGASRSEPLKVTFTPTAAQTYTGELRITYSGSDPSVTATRTIQLTGKGVHALIENTPDKLVFRTPPETTDTKEIVVTNRSEVAIELETVTILPTTEATSFSYSIEGWPDNKRIEPDAFRKITVRFRPSASTLTEERTLSVRFAGSPAPSLMIPLSGKAGRPAASFGASVHQFTNVPKGDEDIQTNSVMNTGATTLRVYQPVPKTAYQNEVTSFSKPYKLTSTQARVEFEWPISVEENDTYYFDVHFRPRQATPSYVSEVFAIRSNSNGNPDSSTDLTVNGTVASPLLALQGPSEFNFTPLLNTESLPSHLTLKNDGYAQLRVVSISVSSEAASYFCVYSDDAPLCSESLNDFTLAHGAEKTIHIKTRAIADTTRHAGKLIISSNSDSSADNPNPRELTLSATAIGELTITPAVLRFEPCNLLARCPPKAITLTNSGGEALEVASIQFDPPGDFSVGTLPSGPIAPGDHTDISLSFSPRSGAAAGHRSATGTITLKSGKTFTFNVTGTATTARLQVSLADPPSDESGTDISSLDFGGVRTGTRSKPLTLVLKNVTPVSSMNTAGEPNTAGELTITKVSVEGRDKALFTLAEPFVPKTLAVNDTVSVTLYFEPKQLAAFSANLVVTSDASEGSQYQVLLSGEGRSSVLEISPYELDFHKTVAGSLTPPKKQVVIKNTSIAPITLTSVGIIEDPARTSPATQADHFSVPPFMPRGLPPGESLSVDVTFLAKAGIASAAQLKITSDAPKFPDAGADLPEGLVKLRGEGLSSVFKGLETLVDFGTLLRPEDASKNLVFTNDSSETIQLLPPILEGTRPADFRVAFLEKTGDSPVLEVPSGGQVKMKIEFRPQEAAVSEASLKLATTAQERAATVTLKGKAVERFLDVDPMEVDFSWANLGEPSEPTRITLTNRSDAKARITILQRPSQAFILDETELSQEIPAGGSVSLSVAFSPVVGGPAEEELTLRLEGTDPAARDIQTDVAIQLRGQGRELGGEGGGFSCEASGTSTLWVGGLLLVALALRRRSHRASP